MTLAQVTARSWRQIRARLAMAGVPDPLRQLPSMHALLDVTEMLLMEGCKDQAERDKLRNQLYRPGPGEPAEGFDADEEMSLFDQAALSSDD